MAWVVLVARVLVGLPFLVFGLNHFLNFMPPPPPPDSDYAKAFMGVLVPTGYLNVVKVLEVSGAVLLLSGRLTPLGIVVLTPVAVNIALWDVLLVGLGKGPPLGVILTGLLVFLMTQYRRHFLPFFVPGAKIGG